MNTLLTRAVLEESHTAKNYLPWARGLAARVAEEPNGIERLRLRIGLAKQLMEEVIPIGLLACKYFEASDDVHISLKIGNQNFDAAVSDHRSEPSGITHIEVTMAREGEQEHLRMWHLHNKGEVSGFGEIIKQGKKRAGLDVTVIGEMASQSGVLELERNLLSRAIERKLGKAYPSGTLLLIGIDDIMAFDREGNIQNLKAVLTGYMPRLDAFRAVVVLGLRKGLVICEPASDAI